MTSADNILVHLTSLFAARIERAEGVRRSSSPAAELADASRAPPCASRKRLSKRIWGQRSEQGQASAVSITACTWTKKALWALLALQHRTCACSRVTAFLRYRVRGEGGRIGELHLRVRVLVLPEREGEGGPARGVCGCYERQPHSVLQPAGPASQPASQPVLPPKQASRRVLLCHGRCVGLLCVPMRVGSFRSSRSQMSRFSILPTVIPFSLCAEVLG